MFNKLKNFTINKCHCQITLLLSTLLLYCGFLICKINKFRPPTKLLIKTALRLTRSILDQNRLNLRLEKNPRKTALLHSKRRRPRDKIRKTIAGDVKIKILKKLQVREAHRIIPNRGELRQDSLLLKKSLSWLQDDRE